MAKLTSQIDPLFCSVVVCMCTRVCVCVFYLYRTTSPNIYACGDCASPYKFTHAADWQVSAWPS